MIKPFEFTQQANHTIAVRGNINFQTAMDVYHEGLHYLNQDTQIFDISEMASADSSGIAVMLAWLHAAKKQRRTIQFSALPSHLRAIASVCGVLQLLGAS